MFYIFFPPIIHLLLSQCQPMECRLDAHYLTHYMAQNYSVLCIMFYSRTHHHHRQPYLSNCFLQARRVIILNYVFSLPTRTDPNSKQQQILLVYPQQLSTASTVVLIFYGDDSGGGGIFNNLACRLTNSPLRVLTSRCFDRGSSQPTPRTRRKVPTFLLFFFLSFSSGGKRDGNNDDHSSFPVFPLFQFIFFLRLHSLVYSPRRTTLCSVYSDRLSANWQSVFFFNL